MNSTSGQYDSIVIGAGHNGLVCASYLARSGRRVLVVEAAPAVGGLAATHEFHPGFRASAAHTAGHFSARVLRELDLRSHGLQADGRRQRIVGLSPNGDAVVIDGETVSGVGSQDVAAYREYAQLMNRFADFLAPFWTRTIPRIGNNTLAELATFARAGLELRRLGRRDMQEFMRVAALPMRDLVDERFEDGLLKAALCWDGLVGSKMAPRSPNGAVLTMLYRHAGEVCEVGNLIDALTACATAAGVEIKTDAPVSRILVDEDSHGLKARGVELAGGEEVVAGTVVSSADPTTTFVELAGVRHLDIGFTNRIRRLRCDGYVAKLHLALDGLPAFTGLDRPEGRLLLAPHMDAIEFAFDDAKYGTCSEHPVMEVTIPTLRQSALAPAGQHVLSAHVMFVPYRLKGGWTDAARDAISARAIDTLERYAPGLREHIVGREFLTPADIERRHGVTGGHWHHAELAVDQMFMMRPTYEAAQYRTPIPGLWLCGAGCHPGGDLTGAAGCNAAAEIVR